MNLVKDLQLMRADGSKVSGSEVINNSKVICLYFSAHWCPPCRMFTPVLKQFYDSVKGQGVEIIFVSSDKSQEDMESYFKTDHGAWLAIQFGDDVVANLKQQFSISGIPSLVVLKPDGTLITKDGRGQVQSQGAAAVQAWL